MLSSALLSHDHDIIAALLSYHSFADVENKINRQALYQSMYDSVMCDSVASMSTLTSGLCKK